MTVDKFHARIGCYLVHKTPAVQLRGNVFRDIIEQVWILATKKLEETEEYILEYWKIMRTCQLLEHSDECADDQVRSVARLEECCHWVLDQRILSCVHQNVLEFLLNILLSPDLLQHL